MPSGQRRVNMVFAQLDAIRYFQPPFSVATPNRNRSLARKSGFPNTQSKDEASRTSKSCTNDSVRVDGYDVIECLDLTESPPSITLQGQAGALVWSKPAVVLASMVGTGSGEAHVIPGEDFGKGVELVQHTETLDDHVTGDETRPEHIREDVPPERKLQQAG
ncbi:MAG: hypothetical protein L6R35_004483 [Caloplaca aegaea]|nr:MAG: hypothetical protein L6R35_004483 [Caloplaca aegaea]